MNESKLRTIVYVDGFNFYYGQVKNGPHKWLDLTKLFKAVLGEENNLIKIKYLLLVCSPLIVTRRLRIPQS